MGAIDAKDCIKIGLCYLAFTSSAWAQVAFQPAGCEFQTVFVVAPDIKEALMPDENGKAQKSTIANLGVSLDGKSNLFRAECMVVAVPDQIDDALLLDDMQTLAKENHLKNSRAWIERNRLGLIGRVRGEVTDTSTKYIVDIHRFIGKRSILDAWVGSPPGTFPSEGNLVFLKEIKLNGQRVY